VIDLRAGDCRDTLDLLPSNSIDSVVTDPPYALVSITKRFGAENAAPVVVPEGGSGAYARASRGFMGKTWDTGEAAFAVTFWREVYRVLKPGGHIVAFSGTRTYHRLACAIEDAGFEIRDQLQWLYGTGFPKSHNADGEWEGWGTALKPASEPIVLARKPLIGTVAANLLAHRTGALNIDGCRIESGDNPVTWASPRGGIWTTDSGAKAELLTSTKGRWPANVLHDGSDEVLAGFPHVKSGKPGVMRKGVNDGACFGAESRAPGTPMTGFGDEGSAARFFYSAKASKADRAGSKHPTVKPVALMRWLVRLVTPPGGTVLDPFAGSGTTGQAAREEGFDCILCEREVEYLDDIRRRLGLTQTADLEDMLA
jgi:site-specific DNA-methyltransferase (adenine-specific)